MSWLQPRGSGNPSARAPSPAVSFDAARGRRASGGALMRAFDIVAASSVLLLTSPLLLVVAFLVWVMDGGPALYSQPRIGRDGRHFRCLKFRSMCVDADVRLANLLATDENARREWQADHKLRIDPRITRLGKPSCARPASTRPRS